MSISFSANSLSRQDNFIDKKFSILKQKALFVQTVQKNNKKDLSCFTLSEDKKHHENSNKCQGIKSSKKPKLSTKKSNVKNISKMFNTIINKFNKRNSNQDRINQDHPEKLQSKYSTCCAQTEMEQIACLSADMLKNPSVEDWDLLHNKFAADMIHAPTNLLGFVEEDKKLNRTSIYGTPQIIEVLQKKDSIFTTNAHSADDSKIIRRYRSERKVPRPFFDKQHLENLFEAWARELEDLCFETNHNNEAKLQTADQATEEQVGNITFLKATEQRTKSGKLTELSYYGIEKEFTEQETQSNKNNVNGQIKADDAFVQALPKPNKPPRTFKQPPFLDLSKLPSEQSKVKVIGGKDEYPLEKSESKLSIMAKAAVDNSNSEALRKSYVKGFKLEKPQEIPSELGKPKLITRSIKRKIQLRSSVKTGSAAVMQRRSQWYTIFSPNLPPMMTRRRSSVFEPDDNRHNTNQISDIHQKNYPLKHDCLYSSSRTSITVKNVNNGRTSSFWIASKDFTVSTDIFYNTPDRLRVLYKIFCQKSADRGPFQMGIDDMKYSVSDANAKQETFQNLPQKCEEFSYYWFAKNDLVVPFNGKYMSEKKIKRLFEFVRTFASSDGHLRFGIDDFEFSKMPDMSTNDPKLSTQTGNSKGLCSEFAGPSILNASCTHGGRSSLSTCDSDYFDLTSLEKEELMTHKSDAVIGINLLSAKYCNESLNNLFKDCKTNASDARHYIKQTRFGQ